MCYRLACVVIQRVGVDDVVATAHFHVIEEGCLACVGVIFAPVGHQHILSVNQLTSFKEVSIFIHTVVVEAVGV